MEIEMRIRNLIDEAELSDNVYAANQLRLLRKEINEEIQTYAIN